MLLDFVVGFFLLIFGLIFKIYCFFKKIVKWLSFPFSWIWEKVQEFFENHLPVFGRLDNRFSAFAGFRPFLLFCAIITFVGVNMGIHIAKGITADYWTELLYSTTLGTFMEIAEEGLVATPATLVAVAFGGFLFGACYDTLEDAKLYVKIPCFVLYFITSANLALLLTDVFEVAGNWLYTNGMALLDDTGGSLGQRFIKILAALPLVYLLLLLCFMTLAEYMETAVFGLVGIAALYLCNWLLGMLMTKLGAPELAHIIVRQIVLWAVVFGLEAARNPLIGLLEDSLD